MSIATSAIERLQGVAGRLARSHPLTSVPLPPSYMFRWLLCTAPRRSTTIWLRPVGATGMSVSVRAPHVSRPTAVGMLVRSNGHSASPLALVVRTVQSRCRRCAALASAMRHLLCWTGWCHGPAQNWPPS